jgi:Mrp family chromosome partitioning ATPase
MTEQSKIPLPGEPAAPPASRTPSSVERAIAGFDLSRLGGIASPLPPEAQRRVVMREVTIEPAHAPVPGPEAAPAPLAAAAAATPAPAPAPVAAPQPAITARSVRFGEARHPVDRANLRQSGLIVPEGSVTGLLEEFRIVKRQLLLHSAQMRATLGAAAQRVLVCSPLPGEGKTYCATNLALAIAAEKESEVVLVDADFAKPSVLSALGLPGGPGLMDALSDPAVDVAECVIGTDVPGLWVLPAGNATTSDTEYLASSRTRAVLDRLTEGAPQRMVIFDSPPALAASPAAELAKYVGQALVVCRADRTGQSSLEDAIALLSGCPNIQLLLNAVQFSPSGRRFGSYYGYTG